jgi:O-antigen ligase
MKFPALVALLTALWLVAAFDYLTQPILSMPAWLLLGVALAMLLLTSHHWPEQEAQNRRASRERPVWQILVCSVAIAGFLNASYAIYQWFELLQQASCCLLSAPNGQLHGFLKQRNQLASLMILAVLANAIWLQSTHSSAWQRRLAIACAMTYAAIAALTHSRTGMLQLIALVLLCYAWRRSWQPRVRLLVANCGLAYGGVAVLSWLFDARNSVVGRSAEAGTDSRLALWSNVLELTADKPWVGWGWNSLAFAHYNGEFSGVRFMELLDNAHNLPLHLAFSWGVPAAVGLCCALLSVIWLARPWQESNVERQFAWGALLLIGLHSLLEYPLWYAPFFMTTLLCVGILCGHKVRQTIALTTTTLMFSQRFLGALLLTLTCWVALDYHRVSQIYIQPHERSSWYAADPLGAAQKSIFFQGHARFALLMSTPLARDNAQQLYGLSQEVIRFSPEPRVIERLIEAAVALGKDDVAAFHLKRYKAAYPADYIAFVSKR